MAYGRLENLRQEFGTWGDLCDAIQGSSVCDDDVRVSRKVDMSGWPGTETWDQCQAMMRDGWSEIRPEVQLLSDHIADDLKMVMVDTFNQRWDVAGQTVDIGRYMSGEPENMVTLLPIKISSVGRVVTILINIGATSHVNAGDIKKRGIAVCALIETLELVQHSTEIWIESTAEAPNADVTTTYLCKVKSASDVLDIERLMFAIANPSMLRRCVFSLRECMPSEYLRAFSIGEYRSSYGTSIECKESEYVGADITLRKLTVNDPTVKDAKAWIRNVLSEFGLLKEN